ncbi:MAG: NAD(P)-binding domain-containing protein [Planctomycetota bacterium]
MGYMKWLHTRWPAGTVEKLPQVNEDYSTNVAGLYIVGDLTGVPLLKFASDAGARAIDTIAGDSSFQRGGGDDDVLDVAIIGAGVSGMAAALQARKHGLSYEVIEASEPFSTLVNFPKGKPIFTYPTDMTPTGDLQFSAEVKEPLLEELRHQSLGAGIEPKAARVERVQKKGATFEVVLAGDEPNLQARRVIVAIGRSGNFRRLGVPGEKLEKVYNRLHDPKDFCGKPVMIVGGGDSALEAAIALAQCGCHVSLSYRKKEFSRPKPENVEKLQMLQRDPEADVGVEEPTSERIGVASGAFMEEYRKRGSVDLLMGSQVVRVEESTVVYSDDSGEHEIPNDAVFAMIGREPPLDFFRRSGVRITGETSPMQWVWILLFLAAITFVYAWKGDHPVTKLDGRTPEQVAQGAEIPPQWPEYMDQSVGGLGSWWREQVDNRETLVGTVAASMKQRSFYYTLGYTLLIGVFGVIRIRRRRTQYVTLQTTCLFLVQLFPLFLLPEVFFPWAGYNGWWDGGAGKWFADSFFPLYGGQVDAAASAPSWGHPREYWKAYGFILAWPLTVWNVFQAQPPWAWLVLSCIQTFGVIPALVYFYGKGAYCGWICSCGGLAETMGDAQRHKMPHGPKWNRLNMVGQVILAAAFVLLALRIYGWAVPDGQVAANFDYWLSGKSGSDGGAPFLVSWKWTVDVLLGGILGVGFYFKYSGRVWCRFACPLAALMHIYARFSRFRIISDKKKCISCNVCTSVCHQGIDVMNFANKGMPMADPQCVRCSACVQSCPTGVLQFGRVDGEGNTTKVDKLVASNIRSQET